MPTKDKRIDTYINRSADFAKPILHHLRELVHQVCPEVEETMKWSFPHFDYHGILCSMAAFKQHCSFGFWKAKLMEDYDALLSVGNKTAMGHFGQLKSLKDLPNDKILVKYIKEAMRLNEEDVKIIRKPAPREKKILLIPADLKKALAKNTAACKTFDGFNYSNKKEYIEWITEAKTDATREKRLNTAIEWMAAGKIRLWKYV
ncbi:MAG: YdeI/OmpD-associated family protein [Bacteroidota bacterium]